MTVQLINRTFAVTDDATAGAHARINSAGKTAELVWSCWVAGPGVKAWEDGSEPAAPKGLFERAGAHEKKLTDRAEELLAAAVERCSSRVKAAMGAP